ncbi:hypothetical protein PVAND_007393 [Polypedilum vanderplanki]|uniref:Uncharacterized protein n=1 Tax=Polypedilum vanderplanki TaxID=319348 RepID=A0A9J6C6V1_POLVA|nr:hypothetical protein PVAND_007393 [Polypedilum vanderplanki]
MKFLSVCLILFLIKEQSFADIIEVEDDLLIQHYKEIGIIHSFYNFYYDTTVNLSDLYNKTMRKFEKLRIYCDIKETEECSKTMEEINPLKNGFLEIIKMLEKSMNQTIPKELDEFIEYEYDSDLKSLYSEAKHEISLAFHIIEFLHQPNKNLALVRLATDKINYKNDELGDEFGITIDLKTIFLNMKIIQAHDFMISYNSSLPILYMKAFTKYTFISAPFKDNNNNWIQIDAPEYFIISNDHKFIADNFKTVKVFEKNDIYKNVVFIQADIKPLTNECIKSIVEKHSSVDCERKAFWSLNTQPSVMQLNSNEIIIWNLKQKRDKIKCESARFSSQLYPKKKNSNDYKNIISYMDCSEICTLFVNESSFFELKQKVDYDDEKEVYVIYK